MLDSSKFRRISLAVINQVENLDKIITDNRLNEKEIERYKSKGVEIIIV